MMAAGGLSLGGCASSPDYLPTAFADPAVYDYHNCEQLTAERKSLASQIATNRGLAEKAETGFAGAAVAEAAYGADYAKLRSRLNLANVKFEENRCGQSQPPPAKR